MFNQKPICEVCRKKEATSFSFLTESSDFSKGDWKFVCDCTAADESYDISINRFFANAPSTVDWLAHMHEKTWMDWSNFMEMMCRFRKATNSFRSM
jgi:hypothetical protein